MQIACRSELNATRDALFAQADAILFSDAPYLLRHRVFQAIRPLDPVNDPHVIVRAWDNGIHVRCGVLIGGRP